MYILYLHKETNQKTETMTNEIATLTDRFENEIALYGITEVFVMAGEVYITSNFDLPFDLVNEIEEEVM